MWKTKVWKFRPRAKAERHSMKAARARMELWLNRNRHLIEYEELFIDNAYGVTYRKLRRIS